MRFRITLLSGCSFITETLFEARSDYTLSVPRVEHVRWSGHTHFHLIGSATILVHLGQIEQVDEHIMNDERTDFVWRPVWTRPQGEPHTWQAAAIKGFMKLMERYPNEEIRDNIPEPVARQWYVGQQPLTSRHPRVVTSLSAAQSRINHLARRAGVGVPPPEEYTARAADLSSRLELRRVTPPDEGEREPEENDR